MKYKKEKLERMLYIQLDNLEVYSEKINLLKKQNELLKKEIELLEKKVLEPEKEPKSYPSGRRL